MIVAPDGEILGALTETFDPFVVVEKSRVAGKLAELRREGRRPLRD